MGETKRYLTLREAAEYLDEVWKRERQEVQRLLGKESGSFGDAARHLLRNSTVAQVEVSRALDRVGQRVQVLDASALRRRATGRI